jgi:hypothetical protein
VDEMKWSLGLVIFIAGTVFGSLFTARPQNPTLTANFVDGKSYAVFVRGDRWGIQVGKADAMLDMLGMYGITDCRSKKIFVRSALSFENQRNTILHELLHAGTCDEQGLSHNKFYNSDSEENHEGIYKIANYISELLITNPELSPYLSRK